MRPRVTWSVARRPAPQMLRKWVIRIMRRGERPMLIKVLRQMASACYTNTRRRVAKKRTRKLARKKVKRVKISTVINT